MLFIEFVSFSSCCPESQREAALLLGQFASTDSDCKVLFHLYPQFVCYPPKHKLFLFGCTRCKLFVSVDFQVHIVQRGAVRPLIEMLQSPYVQLKEMSAFALGRLAQVPLLNLC